MHYPNWSFLHFFVFSLYIFYSEYSARKILVGILQTYFVCVWVFYTTAITMIVKLFKILNYTYKNRFIKKVSKICKSEDFFIRIWYKYYSLCTLPLHKKNAYLGIYDETTILDSFYTSANGGNSCILVNSIHVTRGHHIKHLWRCKKKTKQGRYCSIRHLYFFYDLYTFLHRNNMFKPQSYIRKTFCT